MRLSTGRKLPLSSCREAWCCCSGRTGCKAPFLLVCQKDSATTPDEKWKHFQEVGLSHLSEFVNVYCWLSGYVESGRDFHPHTGLSALPHSQWYDWAGDCIVRELVQPPVLDAESTQSHQKCRQDWALLLEILSRLAKDRPTTIFINADLIESFLNISWSKMQEVVANLQCDNGSWMQLQATTNDCSRLCMMWVY